MPRLHVFLQMNYDGIASEYAGYGIAGTDWECGYAIVLKRLSPVHGVRVLDFGCGNGKFSEALVLAGATVTGVDVSSRMVDLAKARGLSNAHFVLAGEQRGVFGAAVLNFVLCTLESDDAVREVLVRMFECLAPGGTLVMLNPHWDVANGVEFDDYVFERSDLIHGCPVRLRLKQNDLVLCDVYRSQKWYVEQLQAAGFVVDSIDEEPGRNQVSPLYVISSKKGRLQPR